MAYRPDRIGESAKGIVGFDQRAVFGIPSVVAFNLATSSTVQVSQYTPEIEATGFPTADRLNINRSGGPDGSNSVAIGRRHRVQEPKLFYYLTTHIIMTGNAELDCIPFIAYMGNAGETEHVANVRYEINRLNYSRLPIGSAIRQGKNVSVSSTALVNGANNGDFIVGVELFNNTSSAFTINNTTIEIGTHIYQDDLVTYDPTRG